MARRAGTSQAAVARYESGASSPAVATLERLLAACGRTLELSTRYTSTRDLSGLRARRLRAAKQELLKCAAKHGARNLRVFGSVARGDDRPDSDVDLLVDLDASRGLLDLAELRDALSDLLGERVDVATLGGLGSGVSRPAPRPAEGSGAGVGKDDRRLYTCPQCNGSQVVVKWKRADVDEEQERATTELCPTCDGLGQILGSST